MLFIGECGERRVVGRYATQRGRRATQKGHARRPQGCQGGGPVQPQVPFLCLHRVQVRWCALCLAETVRPTSRTSHWY